MWATLKSGSWLTPERLRVYPALLLSFEAIAILVLVVTSDGRHDFLGRPLGTDFAQVWIAGREALGGHPEQPFDLASHFAEQRTFFGPASDVYGWHYPPYFLGLAALLALMPYPLALAVWQLTTLPLYLAGIAGVLRQSGVGLRDALITGLAFPAAFVNLTHGHNGFLTASLFTGALLSLEARPWLAGLLFGLLAYKPQFGLVIPVALIAGQHWRALIGGMATIAAMTVLSVAAFGVQTWSAFQQSLVITRRFVLEQGDTGWEKIQSVFSAARMLGGTVSEAYVLQAAVSALVVGAVAWLWHSRADVRLKCVSLLCAGLLATPYSLDYDMVLLGPAIAFVAAYGLEKGFAPFEKTLLAAVWVTPLLARLVAKLSHIPVGAIAMLTLFAFTILRSRSEALSHDREVLAPARTRST